MEELRMGPGNNVDEKLDPGKTERKRRPLGIGLAALILILLFVLVLTRTPLGAEAIQRMAQHSPAVRIGSRLPDFALPTVTQETFSSDQLAGRVGIINFWATWCPPCRAEMPALQEVYHRHREHGLALVGVDFGEDRAVVLDYAVELGLNFPLLLDPEMTVAQRYGVEGLPTTVFVDRQGIIRDLVLGGPMNVMNIEDKILPLLDVESNQEIPHGGEDGARFGQNPAALGCRVECLSRCSAAPSRQSISAAIRQSMPESPKKAYLPVAERERGRKHREQGQGGTGMPARESRYTEQEMWEVISYLRSFTFEIDLK